jgi:branched-chain amino acid transport system permease protein
MKNMKFEPIAPVDKDRKKFGERVIFFCWANDRQLIVLLILFLLVFPLLPLSTHVIRTAILIMIYSVLAMALNLPAYTGEASIGNSMFFAVGAYTTAIITTRFQIDFFATLLPAMFFSALLGFWVGMPTLRLKGNYLCIVTMGCAEIVRMILTNWTGLTNGTQGIRSIPRPEIFGNTASLENGGLYYIMLAILLFVSFGYRMLMDSKIGRAFISIGEDDLAATMMGVRVTLYKVLSFVLSAAITGLAGAFYAPFMRFIEPNSFTMNTSILILSIIVLGGVCTQRGAYLGAFILILLPEILRSMETYRFVFYGLILIVMMVFRPQGLLGWECRTPYRFPRGFRVRDIDGDLSVLAPSKMKTS